MQRKIVSALLWAIFVGYVLVMVWLLFRPDQIYRMFTGEWYAERRYNFELFDTIRRYVISRGSIPEVAMRNLVGNVGVFVPCGLFLQTLRKSKRVWSGLLLILLTTAAVEVLQFVLGVGALDVDDVILNFLGGVLGMMLVGLLRQIWKKNEDAVRFWVLILLVVLGVIFIMQ